MAALDGEQRGYALKYASEELRGDTDLMMVALEQNMDALDYVSEKLKKDEEFMKTTEEVWGQCRRS